MTITLMRSKDGSPWEKYAEFEHHDKQKWPTDLPADIAKLIADGLEDPVFITNMEKHSQDGYRYRISSC